MLLLNAGVVIRAMYNPLGTSRPAVVFPFQITLW